MIATTWIEAQCPRCGAGNFLDNGDTSDLTACDVESCRCWSCGYCFDLGTGEAAEDPEGCEMGIQLTRGEPCKHVIVDARNEVVESGYTCIECGMPFEAGDHGEG